MQIIGSLAFPVLLLSALSMFAEQEITVAAAADLQPMMQELATRFESQTHSKVKLSFGSSGNFFAQVQNGAPYDLFFSADVSYPQKLQDAGLAQPGSLYEYARGKIVLWAPQGSVIDVNKGLSVAADPAVKRLAIANPAHAPYGRAAQAALTKVGLWEKVARKLVMGENIAQTAEFVQSGNADAGILALSLALSPSMRNEGRYFEIPQQLYPPLRQSVVILKRSQHKEDAEKFLEFMKTPATKSLLLQYGFAPPGNP
ncbi:MAG: molybdate ABC transporter substrate-binding protein [Terriglobales bacterium]